MRQSLRALWLWIQPLSGDWLIITFICHSMKEIQSEECVTGWVYHTNITVLTNLSGTSFYISGSHDDVCCTLAANLSSLVSAVVWKKMNYHCQAVFFLILLHLYLFVRWTKEDRFKIIMLNSHLHSVPAGWRALHSWAAEWSASVLTCSPTSLLVHLRSACRISGDETEECALWGPACFTKSRLLWHTCVHACVFMVACVWTHVWASQRSTSSVIPQVIINPDFLR